VGLLDGGLSAVFNAAFAPLYLPATIHAGTGEPIYGPGGTITGYQGGDTPARAQVDAASDAMRSADGFAEGDVRLIVLSAGVGELSSDHEITVNGVRYRLQSVELDAVGSHWVCRGRRI